MDGLPSDVAMCSDEPAVDIAHVTYIGARGDMCRVSTVTGTWPTIDTRKL